MLYVSRQPMRIAPRHSFFTLNQYFLFLSLVLIFFGVIGGGGTNSNLSTLEIVLFWVGSLAVFLFTTFIEIRNLFPFLPWWHLGVGIAAGIALIAIISFGWPALLVVGIVLIIYAAIGWAKDKERSSDINGGEPSFLSWLMIVNQRNITTSLGAGLVTLLLVSGGLYFIISNDSSDAMGGIGNYTVITEEKTISGPDEYEYISDGETLEIFYTWDGEVPEGFQVYDLNLFWTYEETNEETNPNGPVEQMSCFMNPGQNALDSTQGVLNHNDFLASDEVVGGGSWGVGQITQNFSNGGVSWLEDSAVLTPDWDDEADTWIYNLTDISEEKIHENLTTNGEHIGDYSISIRLDAEVGEDSGCPHSDEGEEINYFLWFGIIKYNISPTEDVFTPSE